MPFAPEVTIQIIDYSFSQSNLQSTENRHCSRNIFFFTSVVKPINPQTYVFLIEDLLRSRFVTAHELKQIQMHTVYYY